MARWHSHSICNQCWNLRNPDRQVHDLGYEDAPACCACGGDAQGLYVRGDDGPDWPHCRCCDKEGRPE